MKPKDNRVFNSKKHLSKKKLIYTILLSFFLNTLSAQLTNLVWAKQMGGTGNDEGNSIATDASGNVYATGSFEGTVDFDPGVGTANLTSAGSSDAFISKFDATGNFVWVKQFAGISSDRGLYITIDANGNIYSTGVFFSGTVDFDPGSGVYNLSSSSGGRFISKLDASGNFVWAKQLSGFPCGIAVDVNGNVFSSGFFSGTVDFDPGTAIFNLTASNTTQYFVSKLDVNGNFLWAAQLGGVSGFFLNGFSIDGNGNVYTIGSFEGSCDFDPGITNLNLTSVGLTDVFISKLDATGNFVWVKQYGSTGYDFGYRIRADGNGNIYCIGSVAGVVDFDPGPNSANISGAGFVLKLDVSSNFMWAKQSVAVSDILSITTDNTGNVYTTGIYGGTVDFDAGTGTYNLTSSGFNDIFISKLNSAGNFVWAASMGAASNDQGNSVAVDGSGNVYTIGTFQGTADFDPNSGTMNLTSAGSTDIFIQKLNQLQTTQLSSASCGITETVLNQVLTCDPVAGATSYKYELTPSGGGSVLNYTYGGSGTSFLLSWVPGIGYGVTYSIRVSALVAGVWTPWGSACNVTTPAPPVTQISAGYCGITLTNLGQFIYSDPVLGATAYKYELVPSGGGATLNHFYGASTNPLSLSWVAGIGYGVTYSIRVAASVGGTWTAWGSACNVTTPAPPVTQISSSYCGITLTNLGQFIYSDPVLGATAYKYELVPSGGGATLNHFYGASANPLSLSWVAGIGYGVTYSIRVAASVGGTWTAWGSACNVTTPAPPVTQISSSYCGITVTNLGQFIYSDPVLGATAYKYELVPSGGGATLNHFYGASANPLSLSWVAGVGYGVTYSIRVAASVGGTWTAWGSACNVTTPAPPTTQLASGSCGITLSALNQLLSSDAVLGATAYKYELTPSGGGTVLNYLYGAGATHFNMSWVSGVNYGVTYNIRVAASVGGTWTPWGSVCNVTTPAGPKPGKNNHDYDELDVTGIEDVNAKSVEALSLSVFPNPTDKELSIELGQVYEQVELHVSNSFGQEVYSGNFNSTNLIHLNIDEPRGIYFVTIRSNKSTFKTIKVIKQ